MVAAQAAPRTCALRHEITASIGLCSSRRPPSPNPPTMRDAGPVHRSSETDQYGVECDLGDTVALGMLGI